VKTTGRTAPSGATRAAPDGAASDQLVRLSVNLSPEVADQVKAYAGRKGVSVTEAVRRAIAILAFVDDAQSRGASLNIDEGGALKEILFLV
jgi:Ribbon-helix-helix protein, copG family